LTREDYDGRWMSAFQQQEEEDATRTQPTFDELARGIAEGNISRGRALKLAGAAILGSTGLLSLFPGLAGAQATCEPTACCECRYSEPGTTRTRRTRCILLDTSGCSRRQKRRLRRRCERRCRRRTPPGLEFEDAIASCNRGTTGTQEICIGSNLGTGCYYGQCS
jgi:hypothetical protein